MWLLRVLAVLLIIAIGVSTLFALLTGDRRYLRLSWQLVRYGLIMALIVFALMFLERVILIPG